MDGTLLDSERLWDVALQELAARLGGRLSTQARRAMVGLHTLESMRVLHDDLAQPWRDPVASAAWIDARVAELFATGLRWRPGARRLVREVRAAGLPTALVTSTVRELAELALDVLGRDNFDVVVCGDEVDRTKPHPDGYLKAAALLAVTPGRCVAIEDSPTGVASAVAAGCAVLAVPSLVPLRDEPGVVVVSTLTGVTLENLHQLVDRQGRRRTPH